MAWARVGAPASLSSRAQAGSWRWCRRPWAGSRIHGSTAISPAARAEAAGPSGCDAAPKSTAEDGQHDMPSVPPSLRPSPVCTDPHCRSGFAVFYATGDWTARTDHPGCLEEAWAAIRRRQWHPGSAVTFRVGSPGQRTRPTLGAWGGHGVHWLRADMQPWLWRTQRLLAIWYSCTALARLPLQTPTRTPRSWPRPGSSESSAGAAGTPLRAPVPQPFRRVNPSALDVPVRRRPDCSDRLPIAAGQGNPVLPKCRRHRTRHSGRSTALQCRSVAPAFGRSVRRRVDGDYARGRWSRRFPPDRAHGSTNPAEATSACDFAEVGVVHC